MKLNIFKNIFLSLLCFLTLFFSVKTLANTYQIEFPNTAEFPKAITLKDGNVLLISKKVGAPEVTYVAKISRDGRILYQNYNISGTYSANAQIVQPENSDAYVYTYHKVQSGSNSDKNEYLATFKDKATGVNIYKRKDNVIFAKSSIVALKNGRVFVAGIVNNGENSVIDIQLFNPTTKTFHSGESLKSFDNQYVDCYEQKDNEVYCVYVGYEDPFISKLKLKHFTVNGDQLTNKSKEFSIKNFYTEFNFLKAIPFNETDALILYQTGNGNTLPKYGNTGKDLYYYHIRANPSTETITVIRYELLYMGCKFQQDQEGYNTDIAVLSQNRVYVACETDSGKLRGFSINPADIEIEEFNFNNFFADDIRYPYFAKFGQSLGIFYTHITDSEKKVAFQIMNFPDCEDSNRRITIPKNRLKTIGLRYYLTNPYPAKRIPEEISIKFKPFHNVTLKHNSEVIKANILYDDIDEIEIIPGNIVGEYYIEFIATRDDPLDKLIEGKTCKYRIYTPECLPQCDSCNDTGTEKHHLCLGCADGPYYYEYDPETVIGDYGKPHNCPRCDISCSTCHGGYLDYVPTTNCKLCDYDNNYFHFEGDNRTCISNDTKKKWEKIFGYAIYLDKTPGENKKHLWRWRACHKNCAECFEKGTDEDNKCTMCKDGYYFYCNQTEGHGIPGSCNNICPNNGFYVTEKEKKRLKCCPCIDHCKECKNNTHCDKCYQPFFKTNNGTLCNESCGYCLAEDRNLWECVNCKTKFLTPRYTWNKTCVNEIPYFEQIKRYGHIIDDECNLLTACKEGCHKCEPLYSDKCTECESNHFKEDHFGEDPQPETFRCFSENTCKGITPYPHDIFLRIGGSPARNFNGEGNVCVNCRKRNDTYRLPENRFYCSNTKIKRTYIDIEEYNKLSYCYTRCASCNASGNGLVMNCTSCRDPSLYSPSYEIFNISLKGEILKGSKAFNCYRKPPKCGIYPFYHDYDLADELGLDDCGDKCDVCLYNMTCPKDRPFYVYSTRECIEYCGLDELFSESCEIEYDDALGTILDKPLHVDNPFDMLNFSATWTQIISSQLLATFGFTSAKNEINNYIGRGQIYNLPESKIIFGNNISIEISSVDIELDKISKLLKGEDIEKKTSILDISECEKTLKKKYGLSNEESLVILKGDFFDTIPEQYITNKVAYQLFSTSIGAFLPLYHCRDENIPVTTFSPLNSSYFLGNYQLKRASATEDGYNVFDPKSDFYNDLCTPFTNENGNDVLLDDRRKDYFSSEFNLCEDGCEFLGYNETYKRYMCKCLTKSSKDDVSNYEQKPMEIPEDFYKKSMGYSNIKLFKCYNQVFSLKGQTANFGSYILMAWFAGLVALAIIYFLKGSELMRNAFKNLKFENKIKEEQPPKDPQLAKEKANSEDLFNNKVKVNYVVKDANLKDVELNYGNYTEDLKDDRTFMKMYWSFLKTKQISIYTFYNPDNIKILKISLYLLFISFYMAFTALFFNDDIIRSIYIYKGNTDAAVHVTNIVLSSICSIIMSFIVRFVVLSERDFHKIISLKGQERNEKVSATIHMLKIKAIVFYILSFIIIGVCWYYISAFCAVFKNSQVHYLLNTFVAFLVCNLWPFVTTAITVGLRKLSLKQKSGFLYKVSQVVSYL